MNQDYRYSLDRSSKKFLCPGCDKKRFVRYLDNETDCYLPPQYGRCDRESDCQYHLNPYKESLEEYPKNTPRFKTSQRFSPNKSLNNGQPLFIPKSVLNRTLRGYEKNKFLENLKSNLPFRNRDIFQVFSSYFLGTIQRGYRKGALTIPFIDINLNVRAIQVKQFDKSNHTTGTDFLHSIISKYYQRKEKPLPEWLESYRKQDKKVSCLFGEHLLTKYPNNPIGLVEAPKTAIYASLFFGLPKEPVDLIWLAVFNKSSFSLDRLTVLEGRKIVVFPDLSKDGSTFKEWQTKAKTFEKHLKGSQFILSDLLEHQASEEDKLNGNDMADYLIRIHR